MSSTPGEYDPAFPAMALDVFSHVLGKADKPSAAGEYVVQEVRELTGARCVVLTEGQDVAISPAIRVINVDPARRKLWADSDQARELYRIVCGLDRTRVYLATESSLGALRLQAQGFDLSVVVPLKVGNERVGTMLALGLPEDMHLDAAMNLLEAISPLIALVLRNAIFYQRQEQVIQERTSELRASNTRLLEELAERRTTEEALRLSEERLRFALQGANDGLWDVEVDSGKAYLSRRGCEILGYSPEEMSAAGTTWDELVHPEDLPPTAAALKDHLTGKASLFRVEQRLRMKSGQWKWVLARGMVVERDANGEPRRMTGTHSDIDDRKRGEETIQQLNAELEKRVKDRTAQLEIANSELSRANKEIEAFSYSVSHDLRAPLRGIAGWSQALDEDFGSSLEPRARMYLDHVRSEARRMSGLIDDMLKLSQLTRGEVKLESVDLSSIAETVCQRLEHTHPGRRLSFVIQPRLWAWADGRLMEIALTNLLGNAVKFTGRQKQSRIELGESSVSGKRAFFVSDNGVGFDEAYASKLFGAFQRLHQSSDFPGSGVGLAIVQRVINRCGGRIWAQGHLNQGATFFFTLNERV